MPDTEFPESAPKRDFLKWVLTSAGVAWLGAVFYPILAYLKPPKQAEVEVSSVKAGKAADIEKDSAVIIRFGEQPVILVHKASGEFRAFSATCTHLDCTVQYKKDLGMIWCACHNGRYDLNGRNVSGPPPRPLDEFTVVVKDGDVIISKKT